MKDPQFLVYKSSFSGKLTFGIQRQIWREVHPFFSLLVLGESFLSGFEKPYTTNFLDRANVNNAPTSGQGFLFLHFISFDFEKKILPEIGSYCVDQIFSNWPQTFCLDQAGLELINPSDLAYQLLRLQV